MIYDAFRKAINHIAKWTPNSIVPTLGERLTGGRIEYYKWAELYLTTRFIFSVFLATALPKSLSLCVVVAAIQISSIIYLLKIVFPVGNRGLRDPGRSLFFAFAHYLEIGFSMGYVYWCCWCLGVPKCSDISLSKSVYFSFITMTTVGYGDIAPLSDITRLLVTIHVVVGLFMLATVIGLFLSLSSSSKEPVE